MSEMNPYEAPQSPLSEVDISATASLELTDSQRLIFVLFCCQILAALLTWVCGLLQVFPFLMLLFAAAFLSLLVVLLICGFYHSSLKLVAVELLFLGLTIKLALEIWEALGEL